MKERTPDVPKPSKAKSIKSAWKKSKKKLPLKVFVSTTDDSAVKEAGVDWRFNKRANFSNPPQGIGNTHKPKNKSSKPKDE